jgi:hypothetical protein
MAMTGLGKEANGRLGYWLLNPNICRWSGAAHARVNRGPKRLKQDYVSND